MKFDPAKQVAMAKGLAENGAGLALVTATAGGLPLLAVLIWATDLFWWHILLILFTYSAIAVVLIRLVASGAIYGVLDKQEVACEMWQRRLDQFVMFGAESEASPKTFTGVDATSNDPATLLTPLAIVTGANSGVGYVTTETLLQCGYKVIMACRNVEAGEEARATILASAKERMYARYHEALDNDPPVTISIDHDWDAVHRRAEGFVAALSTNVKVMKLDVGDLHSIDAFADAVLKEHFAALSDPPTTQPARWGAAAAASPESEAPTVICHHDGLRVLVNNAGLYEPTFGKLTPVVGVEGLLGVNYVGPTYLTHRLVSGIKGAGLNAPSETMQLDETVPAASRELPLRVVNLSSVAHTWAMNETDSDDESADNTAKLLKVLEALGDPSQSVTNNLTLKKYIKNTYGLSKTGMIALTTALTALPKKLEVSAFALHPGAVRTSVFRSAPRVIRFVVESVGLLLFKTAMEGAAMQTYLSLCDVGADDTLATEVQRMANAPATCFASDNHAIQPNEAAGVGHYFSDSGAASDPATGLVSVEAANPQSMLAMNKWAMEKLRHHRQ